MLKMKAAIPPSSLRKPGGNEIARAHKLQIEVESDDEDLNEAPQPATATNAKIHGVQSVDRSVKSMTPDGKRGAGKSNSPAGKAFKFTATPTSQKAPRLLAVTPPKRQTVSRTPPKTATNKTAKPIIIRPPSTPQSRPESKPEKVNHTFKSCKCPSDGHSATCRTPGPTHEANTSPSRLPRTNSRQRLPYKRIAKSPSEKHTDPSSLATLVTKVSQKTKPLNSDTEAELKARANMIYKEHLFNTFHALKFVKSLPPVDPQQLNMKKVVLDRRAGYEQAKTVVFDLDETLVHCVDDPNMPADVRLPVTFPNGDVVEAGINIRPYAVEILKAANKAFEVIIFTASHSCYADVVLDFLDPDNSLIHHRFYRENCILTENVHIKDLRIFANRRLQDIVLVDNAAYSFGYQLDNGIPIISWHNDVHDKELYNLIEYLRSVEKADDVRVLNRKTFRLNTFYEDYLSEYLQTKALSPKRA